MSTHRTLPLFLSLLILFCSAGTALAKDLVVSAEVRRDVAWNAAPGDARMAAAAEARRLALNKAAEKLRALAVVQKSGLGNEQAAALAPALFITEVASERRVADKQGMGVLVTVSARTDGKTLEKRAKALAMDSGLVERHLRLAKQEKALLAKLKRAKPAAGKAETSLLTLFEERRAASSDPAFEEAAQGLAAVVRNEQALAGMAWGRYADPNAALAELNRAADMDPELADTFANRGDAFSQLARFNEALGDYDRALALDPKYARAHLGRGLVLARLHRPGEALGEYDAAVKLNPKLAEAYALRGEARLVAGQTKKALADLDKAVGLNAHDALARKVRGDAYRNLGRFSEAVAEYDAALALDPGLAAAVYAARGVAHLKSGSFEQAVEDYDRAIAEDPDYAPAYVNRGDAHGSLKQLEAAAADYTKALELDPGRPCRAPQTRPDPGLVGAGTRTQSGILTGPWNSTRTWPRHTEPEAWPMRPRAGPDRPWKTCPEPWSWPPKTPRISPACTPTGGKPTSNPASSNRPRRISAKF